eukprot:scaffold1081_cov112-Isochrysis_galbana.AAC.6
MDVGHDSLLYSKVGTQAFFPPRRFSEVSQSFFAIDPTPVPAGENGVSSRPWSCICVLRIGIRFGGGRMARAGTRYECAASFVAVRVLDP